MNVRCNKVCFVIDNEKTIIVDASVMNVNFEPPVQYPATENHEYLRINMNYEQFMKLVAGLFDQSLQLAWQYFSKAR